MAVYYTEFHLADDEIVEDALWCSGTAYLEYEDEELLEIDISQIEWTDADGEHVKDIAEGEEEELLFFIKGQIDNA